MIKMLQLRVKRGSVIKRQKSQTASDYEWLHATTSDYEHEYEWLWLTTSDYKPLQPTTRDYKLVTKWLQVTTNDYKRLPAKLRMTTTGIGNNLRHKSVYHFLWLHNNKESKYVEKCSKNSCATLLVKIIKKCLRYRSSHLQMSFKVSVLKKALNPAILLKRHTNTKDSCEICKTFKNNFFTKHLWWLLLAMGAPYSVKLEVMFFIKKFNFIHQGFLPQF